MLSPVRIYGIFYLNRLPLFTGLAYDQRGFQVKCRRQEAATDCTVQICLSEAGEMSEA